MEETFLPVEGEDYTLPLSQQMQARLECLKLATETYAIVKPDEMYPGQYAKLDADSVTNIATRWAKFVLGGE